ncbi:MAG: hypothetical protein Q4D98_11285 [Planctomycetia bacterium]|nr:hypothetical protein [Planctomycetia bacterium]
MSEQTPGNNAPLDPILDEAIERTRNRLCQADRITALLRLAGGLLAFGFLAAVGDHVWPGGMPWGIRWLMGLVFWGGVAAYVGRVLLPLFRSGIHPLYAAWEIETEHPELKNGLLNLLFLKKESRHLGQVVRALERQTATQVGRFLPSLTVDYGPALRAGYFLAGAFFLFAVYFTLSPKSGWTSVVRLTQPWRDVAAPTRVEIEEIMPGSGRLFPGQTLEISARIRNLRASETPEVVFDTCDRQTVGQTVPMTLPEKSLRHVGEIPDVRTPIRWKIRAGDAKSEVFETLLEPPLSSRVERVELTPPRYTGLPVRTVEAGDFEVLEGTRIRLWTRYSTAIGKTWLRGDALPRGLSELLPVERKKDTAEFVWTAEVPGTRAYRVDFEIPGGFAAEAQPQHFVEVKPDLPPEVGLLEAPEDGASIPADGVLTLRVTAQDDFAVCGLAFRAEWKGKPLAIPAILNLPDPRNGLSGEVTRTFRWKPSEVRLEAGDTIVWRVEAADNRRPEANRTQTETRMLRIGPPEQETSVAESLPEETPETPENALEETSPENMPSGASGASEGSEQESGESSEIGETSESSTSGESGGSGEGERDENQPETAGEDFDPLSPKAPQADTGETDGETGSQAGEKEGEAPQDGGETSDGEGEKNPDNSGEGSQPQPGQEGVGQGEKPGEKNADAPTGGTIPEESGGERGEENPGSDASSGEGEKSDAVDSDATDAPRPGQGNGQSSSEEFPDTPDTKDSVNPDNLKETDGGDPNRDTMEGEPGEGGTTRPDTSRTDPESNPGEAFEKMLAHQNRGKGEQRPASDSQKPAAMDEDGEAFELQKNPKAEPKEGDSSGKPKAKGKSSRRTGDDHASGKASTNENAMQDHSVEANTRQGDQNPGTPKGGQDPSDQQGLGRAGSNTPNEQGSPSGSGGDGPIGSQGGAGQRTEEQTGTTLATPDGDKQATSQPEEGAGRTPSAGEVTGNRLGASMGNQPSAEELEPDMRSEAKAADAANVEFARRQTLLALTHLRETLESGDGELLAELGWTRAEAEAFLKRWQTLHAAQDKTPEAETLTKKLRNLGLSRGNRAVERNALRETDRPTLRDTRRIPPPDAWRETFEIYSKDIAKEQGN